MNKALIFAACLLLNSNSLHAQEQAPEIPQRPEPKTKLEAFSSRTGQVVVKSFEDIGEIKGTSKVTVEAREIVEAASGIKQQGIIIAAAADSRYGSSKRSFIDADEIEALLAGIDYISKFDPKNMKLPSWEADYSTKGGLKITVFATASGKIEAAIEVGSYVTETSFISLAELGRFREFVVQAQKKLAEIK